MLLGAFAKAKKDSRVLDLGCGVGVLTLICLLRSPTSRVVGLEITEGAARLAQKNLELCQLEDRGKILVGDMRQLPHDLVGAFDLCISNPPYFDPQRGFSSPSQAMAAARNQSHGDIFDVCAAAARSLKWGGRFCLCYPPTEMAALFGALAKNRLEPKIMRMVHPTGDKPPCLLLLEARKGGGAGLKIEPPLIISQNGEKTEEFKKMYTLEDAK